MTKDKIEKNFQISEEFKSLRLDQALAKLLPEFSRTEIQDWLKTGEILVDGKITRAKEKVIGGEEITISASFKDQPEWQAEDIALDIVYNDEDLMVINKPVGMVVHPAAGNFSSTLLNALLHHTPELKDLPRAGIIHRIDKDTSGLLIIAKNHNSLNSLTKQLKKKSISRIYHAIIQGVLTSGGTIDKPIGRHSIKRKKMAVTDTGKPAVTHYRIIERYRAYTKVKVILETGRTHQIRVHFADNKHPLLGDQTYGGRLQLPKGASSDLVDELRSFKRQALHAYELTLEHPTNKKPLTLNAPVPADMAKLIKILQEDAKLS